VHPEPDASPPLDAEQPPAWKSRRAWAAGIALVVVASTLIGFAFAIRSERSRARASVPVRIDSVAGIDPGTGRVVRDVPLGAAPQAVVAGFGRLWIGEQDHDVAVVRAADGRRLAPAVRLAIDPLYLAAGAGGVWAFDGLSRLAELDPRTSRVVGGRRLWPCTAGCGGGGVAVIDGRVWVGQAPGSVFAYPHGRLLQLDSRTLATAGRVSGVGIGQLGSGYTTLWSISGAGGLVVDRIDPATGNVQHHRLGNPSTGQPTGIVPGHGSMWAGAGRRLLYRFAPGGGYTTIRLPGVPVAVAAAPDGIWVATARGSVLLLNPSSGKIKRSVSIDGRNAVGMVFAAGRIWVAVGS
jgi:hypothetical protein